MKNAIATLIVLLLATALFAQEETPKAEEAKKEEKKTLDTTAFMKKTYTIHGGMNFSSMSMRYTSYGRYRSNSSLGFHIGGMMDMPLTIVDIADDAYLISVHPGAQFVKKGGKRTALYLYSNFKYAVNAYYLEFPVLFSFKRNFSENFSARADLGPYIALGLFGDQEYGYAIYESESSFSDNGLSRLDGGMYYGTTLEFSKKYSVGFHAGSGFTDDNVYAVYITLGYKL
jgi:hypothetical protein